MQFKVVAVAMLPRFHHIQHLNEVTIRRRLISAKWLERVEVVLLVQQNCVFLVVMKVSDE